MSIGPVLGYTANFNFTLISYDFPRWQSYEYDNWNKLDATIAALYGGAGIAGVWKNGTAYAVSQRLIDTTNNTVYVCLVAHTTPATGTFAQERAASPSYWSSPNITPTNRGAWATATNYAQYDYVQSGNQFAVCVIPHVSGVFATDVSAGKWNVLIDLTGYNPTACLVKANNLSDLTNVATARTNLGLGSVALLGTASVFQTTNNLSEGNPASMRISLGLGTAATQASGTFAQVGNNLSDIVNKAAARSNLGLGSLATQNTIDPNTQISTAGTFGKQWLTTSTNTQASALLPNFVGDPGTSNPGVNGTAGLVPAPVNGDAANNRFLSAGGSWSTPSSAAPTVPATITTTQVLTTSVFNQRLRFGAAATANQTWTLPSGVNPGFYIGTISNETTRYLLTIGAPSGIALEGVAAGSFVLAPFQRVVLYYDSDGWHIQWVDRMPLLLVGSYSSTAAINLPIPPGYSELTISISNFNPVTSGSTLTARLSADNGSTFRSGASDYATQNVRGAAGTPASGNAVTTSMQLGFDQSSSFNTSRAGKMWLNMDTRYGSIVGTFGGVTAAPATITGTIFATQNEGGAALITPNVIQFLASAGNFSCTMTVRGTPST